MAGEFQRLCDQLRAFQSPKPPARVAEKPVLFTRPRTPAIDVKHCRELLSKAISAGALTATAAAKFEHQINRAADAQMAKAAVPSSQPGALRDWKSIPPAPFQQ